MLRKSLSHKFPTPAPSVIFRDILLKESQGLLQNLGYTHLMAASWKDTYLSNCSNLNV